MWLALAFFVPIAILLFIINEQTKKRKDKINNEELSEDIEDMQNYCKEHEVLIQNTEDSEVGTQNEVIETEENQPLHYDDTVSEEETQKELDSIKNDELSVNEIIFLKFMNNKDIAISFSSRWEFMYEIKPRIEVSKLLKLEYLTYSSWYDNVKSATMKELKEILKQEGLPVSGNKQELIERVLGNVDADLLERTFNKGKYILTDKGNKIIEKNKRLFMSDREKAGREFEELTDAEYKQLQVFHKVNEYKRLKHNELSFDKGYRKNDILWFICNKQKDIYIYQKDYDMVGIVYNWMCNILDEEEKYEQEIQFLICCMYFKSYTILPSDIILDGVDYYESRMKKHCKYIKKLMKKCNKDINDFNIRDNFITSDIKIVLEHYIPNVFLDFEKVNMFQRKINEFLDT